MVDKPFNPMLVLPRSCQGGVARRRPIGQLVLAEKIEQILNVFFGNRAGCFRVHTLNQTVDGLAVPSF